MHYLNELRVPGLGLAAAIPDELMTEPRYDPRVIGDTRSIPITHRLFNVFRPAAHRRGGSAGTKSMAAPSPGKDLARA